MEKDYDKMLPEAEWAESLQTIYKKQPPKGQGLDAMVA